MNYFLGYTVTITETGLDRSRSRSRYIDEITCFPPIINDFSFDFNAMARYHSFDDMKTADYSTICIVI